MGDIDWQCGDCSTLIERPNIRKCPTCGGINFYPLADEVPGDGEGAFTVEVDINHALERISSDESEQVK